MAKYRAQDLYENMGNETNPQTGVTVMKKEGQSKSGNVDNNDVMSISAFSVDEPLQTLADKLNYTPEQTIKLARSYVKGYITDQSRPGKCDVCGETTNSYERTLCYKHALEYLKTLKINNKE